MDNELLDEMTVPAGYDWKAIIRWGDPLFWNSPAFDPALPNGDAQELQFGYNNDYLDILVQDRRGRQALLCCNHEYVNRGIMFPPFTGAQELEAIKATIAAVGFSVVELERNGTGRPWRYVRGGRKNRRITAHHTVPADRAGGGQRSRQDGGRSDRHPGVRHLWQLFGWHDAVGHDLVRRGELQRLLPRQS